MSYIRLFAVCAQLLWVALSGACSFDSAPLTGNKPLGNSTDTVQPPERVGAADASTTDSPSDSIVDAASPTQTNVAPQSTSTAQPGATISPPSPTTSDAGQAQVPPPSAAAAGQAAPTTTAPSGASAGQPAQPSGSAGSAGRSAATPPSAGSIAPPPAADPPHVPTIPTTPGRKTDPGPPTTGMPDAARTKLPEELVDAAISVLDANKRAHSQAPAKPDAQAWRASAENATELSAALVTPVLRALSQDKACAQPSACKPVCDVMARDCAACARDKACTDLLAELCGKPASECRKTP